ncbi:deoxyribonuclease IV [Candidatus Mycoplasma haematominutum]|uniref:Probable endonuclease 4 n=1 Tax=Candidatus Mycoplasma haematominutum 'Birmingham 1' TaxID=1116213 RepID=G8C3Y7_9MOLU|nr:deoxyribonuclease IV [Candidatus Mycoplasma haematominutum]CCE67035.1 endonuclease IV [Candidatus Mycoplasma haematominutum 'Birmingham 1']
MSKRSLLLGSHISLRKERKYLVGVVQETIDNGANIFMIFTGPPQNLKRIPIPEMFLSEALSLARDNKVDFEKSVVHAPYIFNLAQEDRDGFIQNLLVNEITRMHKMGIKNFVVHPGYYTGRTLEEGLHCAANNIRSVLNETKSINYWFCIETMAGKSNQLGKNIGEIQKIFELCDWDSKLGVCLDTCHLHDSGYDLSKIEEFKGEIDKSLGLNRVRVIHLGDSMNPQGSKKDRHANYGYGNIGWDTICSWAYDPHFSNLSIIVETPFWRKKVTNSRGEEKIQLVSPYKHEIKLLRQRKWEAIPHSECIPIFNIRDGKEKVS